MTSQWKTQQKIFFLKIAHMFRIQFFLDKIDGISIDSSRSAYGRPAMSNLDSPDHITLRMDQNSGPKNFGFQKGHSRAHFFGSSGANGSIEHTQTIVSICHIRHIMGRPFQQSMLYLFHQQSISQVSNQLQCLLRL